MAGRPALKPGELGSVSWDETSTGVRGRARVRDAAGVLRRIQKVGPTRERVQAALLEEAAAMVHRRPAGRDDATLGELLADWVEHTRRVRRHQTARTYASTVKWLTKECGGLSIRSFDLHQAKSLLRSIAAERTPAAARQAKVALNGAFARAIDRELVSSNPLRDLRVEEPEASPPNYLTIDQVQTLRRAVIEREERTRPDAGPSAGILRWGIEVCLGSGLRIGEVLALRHADVDLDRGIIEVRATLVDSEYWKNERQAKLKALSQARRVVLPTFAVAALASAREAAKEKDPHAPAIQSRAGTWVSPRNFRRQLREVRRMDTVVRALALTDLKPENLTPHIFRRTASTLVALEQGSLSGASNLLGHTDLNTTRKHYVGVAWSVIDESSTLERVLGIGLPETTEDGGVQQA